VACHILRPGSLRVLRASPFGSGTSCGRFGLPNIKTRRNRNYSDAGVTQHVAETPEWRVGLGQPTNPRINPSIS